MEEYLRDIICILDAAKKHGKLDGYTFPDAAFNSITPTSELIKEMEEEHLIENAQGLGITLRQPGESLLWKLKNETVTKTLLSQTKHQGESPSVAYIVGEVRRIAKELGI